MANKKIGDRHSDFVLFETFPLNTPGQSPGAPVKNTNITMYSYLRKNNGTSYLVIKGAPPEDIIAYICIYSPEVYATLITCMERGSLFIDLEQNKAWNSHGEDNLTETTKILEALSTISIIPKRFVDFSRAHGIVSIILSGGKGSRMRSGNLHKVCFPIAGRPAINRLLEQLESIGIQEHIIVVGEKGKQVVTDVTEVHDNVIFVYQINQTGTGNAAKQAAYLLRSQGFAGSILVIPGDKVLEKSALERLRKNFDDSHADIALMTADKKIWPNSGRVLFDRKGQPIDIIEKRDIQKIALSKRLLCLKREKPKMSSMTLYKEIIKEIPSLPKARIMFPRLMEYLESNTYISLSMLQQLIPYTDTVYTIERDGETLSFSDNELENITPIINASVYLLSSDAFYQSVFKINSDNAQKEEYMTDIVRLLSRDSKKSWKIIPVPVKDRYEVMSYNNPEELLNIEEYYNSKEVRNVSEQRSYERIDASIRREALRSVEEWIRIFDEFGPEIKHRLHETYGNNEQIIRERRNKYLQVLQKYCKIYGKNNSVIIARSPGRVNLMGRHVDHRGGFANYMTINREAILVASVRDDDVIHIYNVDSQQFRPRSFSIGGELASLPWDEWLNIIDSDTVTNLIRSSRGDWSNYFKAACLRIQEHFKGKLLYGFNGVFSSNIPLAAGLSSSSAIVVSAAEALTFINGLSFMPKEFVDICGEGEWFVGTRGGSGDHAAMKFGEKGKIIHIGFHDIRVIDSIPFPEEYRLIILQSHQHAKKSEGAMQIYNEKVAAYEVAQAIVKTRYPHFRDRLKHLRDINAEHLGIKPYEIYDILLSIPEFVTRKELMEILDEEDKRYIKRIFSSHKEPKEGYPARRVALFGLAEIARASEFARLIKEGNVTAAGQLMNISHNGDRVRYVNKYGEQKQYDNSAPDEALLGIQRRLAQGDSSAALYLRPGGYGCSTHLIDGMVNSAIEIEGVVGAQLSGAGLGGCIMALTRDDVVEHFNKTMISSFYEKYNLPQNILVCSPIAGSGIFTL